MNLYLSSYDYKNFDLPIKVVSYSKTVIDGRNVLIVELDKPLNEDQKIGLNGIDIITLYLINRVDENAFDKLKVFPIDVHVLIPRYPDNLNPTKLSELRNIVWARLYDNLEDAKNHKI